MQIKFPQITFSISPDACIGLALALLLVPLPWIVAWFCAALIHELGHYIALYLCDIQIYGIQIGISGIKMKIPQLSLITEILCAAAGPIAGSFLLVFVHWMPRLALCAAFQCLCNLIPVYPMDGGRVLSGLMLSLFPHKAPSICRMVSVTVLMLLFFLAVYACICLRVGILPVIAYGVLLFQCRKAKSSCKPSRLRVQ